MSRKELPDGNEALWQRAKAAGLTRRQFLYLLSAGGVAAVLAACGVPAPAPSSTPSPIPAPSPTRQAEGGIMWNQFRTDAYESMLAETINMAGHKGDSINAYFVRPSGSGPFPGVVLVHHLPGWDEFYRETARRFAQHGYVVICPNLFYRFGHGTPEEVAAKARGQGGVPDDSVVGDSEAAMRYLKSLPYSNGKVGIIGTCSGGRHAFLVAGRVKGFNAIVDCWGGRVVQSPQELTAQNPVAPLDYTKDLSSPLLGLFGNEDQNPSPEHVNILEAELKKYGKPYTFHRYDGAGHGFWYYDRPAYRPQQAMDGWQKVFAFFGQHLQG